MTAYPPHFVDYNQRVFIFSHRLVSLQYFSLSIRVVMCFVVVVFSTVMTKGNRVTVVLAVPHALEVSLERSR